MSWKRNGFDIVLRFLASRKILVSQGMWLTGRLCGLWTGDAPGDTPWADRGNAAVN